MDRRIILYALLFISGCVKQPEPPKPTIPVCNGGVGTTVSDPNWLALPLIPTATPIFRNEEKIVRSNFKGGTYDDGITGGKYSFFLIADATDGLFYPTDIAVNPIRTNELWITNFGEPRQKDQFSDKGHTTTIFNPGENNQFSIKRKDKSVFTRHFFSYPSSIAFNKEGYWANTSLQNNNRINGPTLWSSDFSIYGDSVKYTTNGSHSSMLHESSVSLGLATDEYNTFWLLDGKAGEVVSYNFGKGHFPGGDDHTDGIIRRYALIDKIQPAPDLPSHIFYDASTKWLYVLNPGKRSVIRLKTNSGTKSKALSGIDSPKEYVEMKAHSEIFLESMSLQTPCGIDSDGTKLYISDYETGRIVVFDMVSKKQVRSIETKSRGIMGIMLEKTDALWYVNHLENKLIRVNLKN